MILIFSLILNPFYISQNTSKKGGLPVINLFKDDSPYKTMNLLDFKLGKGFLAYWHKFILRKNYIVSSEQNPEAFLIEDIEKEEIKQYFSSLRFKNNLTSEYKGNQLNILVFNSEYSKDVQGIKNILDSLKIDIAIITEVDDLTKRSIEKGSLEEIAGNEFNFIYGPEFWEKDTKSGEGYTGNLILSKLKLKNFGFKFLDNCFPWNDWVYEPRIGSRNFVYAEISLKGKNVLLISTHLEDKCNDDSRIIQMQTILPELQAGEVHH